MKQTTTNTITTTNTTNVTSPYLDELTKRVMYKWQAGGKKPHLLSSPGCFTGDIHVMTPSGPVEIRKLKPGDTVYNGAGEHTKLANVCRIDDDPKPMIYWTTNAGQKKGATYDHPFYDARTRRFYPLYQFIWRGLETRQRTQLELLCKQYGQTFDPHSLRGIQAEDYATSDGRKWIPTYAGRWANGKDTPLNSADIFAEPAEQNTRESQEFQQDGQPCRQSGVDNSEREPRLQLSRWTYPETNASKSNISSNEAQVGISDKRLCELLEQRVRTAEERGRNLRDTEKQNQSRHVLSQIQGEPSALGEETRPGNDQDISTLCSAGHETNQTHNSNELRISESKLRDITIRESEPYYSIEIQGRNKTYIIEDGWVVHNCGKTAFVNHLADVLNVNVRVINLSTFEEMDANGMPYLTDKHELTISQPFWLQGLKDGDILFLDEFFNAQAPVRNAFLQIILDLKLPSGVPMPELRIIAASNPDEDLEGFTELSNAMKDRWAFIPFSIPQEEWLTLFSAAFNKPHTPKEHAVREDIAHFLTLNPQMLEHRKPLDASKYGITSPSERTAIAYTTPTRRSWDNLARELAFVQDDTELNHLRKNMFLENVGLEAWRTYKEYAATKTKPLSSYMWDGEPDEITQQVNRLLHTEDLDKQVAYFIRAHKYCKQREVVASMLAEVLKNLIGKYALAYKEKYPDFYKIYQEMGA